MYSPQKRKYVILESEQDLLIGCKHSTCSELQNDIFHSSGVTVVDQNEVY
jgi:hypothetical protein